MSDTRCFHCGARTVAFQQAIDDAEEISSLQAENRTLRAEIEALKTPNYYWDDRCLEAAYEPNEIGDYDDVGDIIELRPIHELPKVFVLITHTGARLFDSREAAESEVSDE